jgi:hypothetical protein
MAEGRVEAAPLNRRSHLTLIATDVDARSLDVSLPAQPMPGTRRGPSSACPAPCARVAVPARRVPALHSRKEPGGVSVGA